METSFSFDNIAEHRKRSQPLVRCIAPVLNSDLFKSSRCFKKPPSRNFAHRLSAETLSRLPATLKAGGEFLRPDTISLGTGRPGPQYFPIRDFKLTFLLGREFTDDSTGKTIEVSTGKYDMEAKNSSVDLAVILNYGYSAGSEQLVRFLTEHMDVVHNPPYSDWQVSLTTGNTAALEGIFRIFCTRGDYILMEKYTYSGVIEAIHPLGLRPAIIDLDELGMIPDHLDNILTTWNDLERGAKKPFLLYMVPTGQNPTGATQNLDRRKALYAVAEKHDLYIIEDDPYYFLQHDEVKKEPSRISTGFVNHAAFLQSLIPSYLSIDISGRVLRLDSTSKIIGPGMRCGWMTGASHLIERFLHYHDVSSVCPSGLSQLAMYNLLDQAWGHSGFIDWLLFLGSEYSYRRDILLHACAKYLPRAVCTWDVPKSGMFLWLKIETSGCSPFSGSNGLRDTSEDRNGIEKLAVEDKIFSIALDQGVMCCKGSAFSAQADQGAGQATDVYFRLSYATATESDLKEAVKRFGEAIKIVLGL